MYRLHCAENLYAICKDYRYWFHYIFFNNASECLENTFPGCEVAKLCGNINPEQKISKSMLQAKKYN